MRITRVVLLFPAIIIVAVAASGAYLTRHAWLPDAAAPQPGAAAESPGSDAVPSERVIVSDRAQANLNLVSKPLRPESYWKMIRVPGMVVARPGLSDRVAVAPVSGVVTGIRHVPGDTVRPGEPLFTLRVLSEPLHSAQAELFKATREVAALRQKQDRLARGVQIGTETQSSVAEVEGQLKRLLAALDSYRAELRARGLNREQIEGVTEGRFVTEVSVVVPAHVSSQNVRSSAAEPAGATIYPLEVQELKAELGQQVQAGQMLCLLANHQRLGIEGRAFRDEIPLLEQAVAQGWLVEVDFEDDRGGWPPLNQSFQIRHIANNVDPVTRTIAFVIPLENSSQNVVRDGQTRLLWRFRPGQKVLLRIPVQRFDNVFVLPATAVVQDGLEAFVFTQNVNTFERKAVRVLLQDRQRVVIANDGALVPGTYVTQSAAVQLNRLVKSQPNAVPKGYHIHADGSLHKNEDEDK